MNRSNLFASVALIGVLYSAPAAAQDPLPPAQVGEGLEEIVVTAQKRSESV